LSLPDFAGSLDLENDVLSRNLEMPYKIGFAKKGGKIHMGECQTAAETLKHARELEAGGETVLFILGLDGVEIDIWELQRLAKSEAGNAPRP
jgi:hypothetical protein